jgi:hypothetical protein
MARSKTASLGAIRRRVPQTSRFRRGLVTMVKPHALAEGEPVLIDFIARERAPHLAHLNACFDFAGRCGSRVAVIQRVRRDLVNNPLLFS